MKAHSKSPGALNACILPLTLGMVRSGADAREVIRGRWGGGGFGGGSSGSASGSTFECDSGVAANGDSAPLLERTWVQIGLEFESSSERKY
jgi:hypothetical protein